MTATIVHSTTRVQHPGVQERHTLVMMVSVVRQNPAMERVVAPLPYSVVASLEVTVMPTGTSIHRTRVNNVSPQAPQTAG